MINRLPIQRYLISTNTRWWPDNDSVKLTTNSYWKLSNKPLLSFTQSATSWPSLCSYPTFLLPHLSLNTLNNQTGLCIDVSFGHTLGIQICRLWRYREWVCEVGWKWLLFWNWKMKKVWHRVWWGHISIQGGQTAGRYHREMVLIKNDMTCPWYTTRYPWQSIKIITNFFLGGGGGVSRVMSSTRDTFCGCSECESASQIWPKRQPQGVPGVSNMAPGVSPMSSICKAGSVCMSQAVSIRLKGPRQYFKNHPKRLL